MAKNPGVRKGSGRQTVDYEQMLAKSAHMASRKKSQQPLSGQNTQNTRKAHKKDQSREPPRPERPAPVKFESEFSETRLKTTLNLPTRAALPKMPNRNPVALLKSAVDTYGGYLTLENVSEIVPESFTPYIRTKCVVQIPDWGELVTIGEDASQEQSHRAASMQALTKMYEADLLNIIWAPRKGSQLKRGRSDFLDVFDYAARYGCIPTFSAKRSGAIHTIRLEMPENGIKAIGRGLSDLDRAYTRAVHAFKEQAESYELSKGTGSLVLKDMTALSTSNSHSFFEFCKDSGELESFPKVEVEGRSDGKEGFVGKLTLGSDVLGTATPRVTSGETATKLSFLIGALSVVKEKPHLLDQFREALRAGNGEYLGKTAPIDAFVGPESLQEMQDLNRFAYRYSRSNNAGPNLPYEERRRGARTRALTDSQLAARQAELQEKLNAYQNRADLAQLRDIRSQLPMSQFAPQLLDMVQNSTYCVVLGATGSGKTTQVPQILLEQAIANGSAGSCNVICTQPRRIAATSVAKRVADERAEKLQDTVGYQVRFDSKPPKLGGSILYCTTGILLQQLQHAPDEVYDNLSHLVIDEVHERDMLIDFLLIIIKKTMAARAAQGKKLPHIVLMSATIDAERFAAYFKDSLPSGNATDCPILSVPGRTFPVTERYLGNILEEMKKNYDQSQLRLLMDKPTREYLEAEKDGLDSILVDEASAKESVIDWKRQASIVGSDDALADNKDDALVPLGLAAITIAHVTKTTANGAILVFLPGLDEIVKLDQMLQNERPLGVNFGDSQRYKIFMLHSSIPDSQKTVFDAMSGGCRKIILSTNIAETSVTIPDVQFVIDSGKSREKRYDQLRRITQLQCTWISKSNAKQRAGRAGRVQNGNYYALYTKSRHESMRAIGLPELLRSDLQEICLDVKTQAFKMPVRDFLAEAIEPPSPSAVDLAMRSLTALEALTEKEELTPLGRLLASLPVHPALGKMIVLGIIFRCLEPMIILGAAAQERPIFVNPPERKREVEAVKRQFAGSSESDHILLLNAFRTARQATEGSSFRDSEVLSRNFIHHGAFKSINSTAKQIEEILEQAGLIEVRRHEQMTPMYGGKMLNENSNSEEMIKALLIAGLHPNIGVNSGNGKMFRTSSEKHTFIHPGSVNSGRPRAKFVAFSSLALSADGGRKNLRDTTLITPLMVLLFGGRLSSHNGPRVELDDWLRFFVKTVSRERQDPDRGAASVVVTFHRTLKSMLAVAFGDLAKKEPLADDHLRGRLANGLARVLTREAGGVPSMPMRSSTSIRSSMSSHQRGNPSFRNEPLLHVQTTRERPSYSQERRSDIKQSIHQPPTRERSSYSQKPRSDFERLREQPQRRVPHPAAKRTFQETSGFTRRPREGSSRSGW